MYILYIYNYEKKEEMPKEIEMSAIKLKAQRIKEKQIMYWNQFKRR